MHLLKSHQYFLACELLDELLVHIPGDTSGNRGYYLMNSAWVGSCIKVFKERHSSSNYTLICLTPSAISIQNSIDGIFPTSFMLAENFGIMINFL